jgi:biotin carboxylase
MRVLLFSTTTGYQLRSFGDAAGKLGIEIMLATDRCHHLDDPWRDGAVPVRFHDDAESLRAITDAVHERPVDGVVAVGDRPTVLAARAAQLLGLEGNPVEAVEAARSKRATRRALAAAHMKVPWFADIPVGADPADLASRIGYPCVVKPLGLSGSRGVIRADSPAQFTYAVERVRTLLARPQLQAQRSGLDDQLLVEGYIDGKEYAVEGVLTRGEFRVFAIFEKPDPLEGPFFEETIYLTPPDLPADVQHTVVETVQRACAALGLVHGPIHAECRIGRGGPVMLEVAARPIGGLCSKVLRFEAGAELVSLEEVLLRHCCGEDISPYARESRAAGVMMIPIPKRGIYKGVLGERPARQVPFVESLEITAKKDQVLEPLPEGDAYLGFIFARASDPATVVSALRNAHKRLTFDIDPLIDVRPA